MRIDVSNLMYDDMVVEVEGQETFAVLEVSKARYRFLEPVSWKATVAKSDEGYLVYGKARVVLELVCDRCLSEYVWEDEIEFSFDTEEENISLDGEFLDLEDVLLGEIVVALPVKLLCRQECKGLCPVCGTDLNEGQCDCQVPTGDLRWAKLNKFFEKN